QMTNVADTATAISKLVNNIDTSVLVGQLSGMIGKDIQWTTEVTEKDASGKSVTSKQTYEGVVTGVSVTDGAPSIIANVNGKSMQVSVGDITRVGKVAEAQG
ncbi:MAG: flagellar biosynthesis protein FlgD, partial [Schwartzia sp.]|nr:flagellar biosynthesis protein FlgD [Schwartzia sp. (in: firmicutes)]